MARDGTTGPVSQDQIVRRERGQGISVSCYADYDQNWQPYRVDPYSAESVDHTYILQFLYNVCVCVCVYLLNFT